jgi:poly(A) polymerase
MIMQSLHRLEDPIEINHRREAVFKTTLKCVKLWSKRAGLDSNKTGYLGGIAWALLTAKICQLFPYESPAKLLERFFWLYGNEWNWDEWHIKIESGKDEENSRIRQRFLHIMTPSWPQMNSTYNANYSTRETLTAKMKEAHAVCAGILARFGGMTRLMQSPECKSAWLGFFTPFDFFGTYDQFLELNILGDEDHTEYLRWSGFVEAKFRILGEKLEDLLKLYDLKIHLWATEFEREPNTVPGYHHITSMYIGFKCHQEYEEKIDLNFPVVRFIEYIEHEWAKSNLTRDPKQFNMQFSYLRRDQIPRDVLEGNKKNSTKSNADGNIGVEEDMDKVDEEMETSNLKNSMTREGSKNLEDLELMKKKISSFEKVRTMSEKKESKNIRIREMLDKEEKEQLGSLSPMIGKRVFESPTAESGLESIQKRLKLATEKNEQDKAGNADMLDDLLG